MLALVPGLQFLQQYPLMVVVVAAALVVPEAAVKHHPLMYVLKTLAVLARVFFVGFSRE